MAWWILQGWQYGDCVYLNGSLQQIFYIERITKEFKKQLYYRLLNTVQSMVEFARLWFIKYIGSSVRKIISILLSTKCRVIARRGEVKLLVPFTVMHGGCGWMLAFVLKYFLFFWFQIVHRTCFECQDSNTNKELEKDEN